MIDFKARPFLYFLLLIFCSISLANLRAQSSKVGTKSNYFQQHVHYTLNATLLDDPESPHLAGTGSLDYTNNSPDTLHEVYFHLYWNLFKSGSYGESAPNRDHSTDDNYGSEGVTVTAFAQQVNGVIRDEIGHVEIDNTILRLKLSHPILPNETRTFTFSWRGELPNFGIRSTWGYHGAKARNFATAQWYPQICTYDQHGWHPDQYVGMGEFYTDYGSYDVSLTLSNTFSTVVSTGVQTNPEILPQDIRTQIEYAQTHPDTVVTVISASASRPTIKDSNITWKFHADSVRDFAWCADEAYIWKVINADGIMHHVLYWSVGSDYWSKEAPKLAVHSERFFSNLAGKYPYKNLFVCETYEGGMEYPGLVFIGPYYSGNESHYPQNTIIHEIGHQWYPMMMGTNETDYGYLDEGMTTFISTLAQEAYYGRWGNAYGPQVPYSDDERTANYRYAIKNYLSGYAEPAETKADMFLSYDSYADPTYYTTSSIFFMLRYAMGEAAFNLFLQEYYGTWKFKHPYPGDLLLIAEDAEKQLGDTARIRSKGDLRWFFDEWFKKDWKLDYALKDFEANRNTATVTLIRNERAVMPVDIVFTFEDGTTEQRWSPVDDWLRTAAKERTYTYTFSKHPIKAEINPSLELLDINRLNNVSTFFPLISASPLFSLNSAITPLDAYAIHLAPFGAYSRDDGGVFGATVTGHYLDRDDRLALGIRYGTKYSSPIPLGVLFQYHTVLDNFSPFTDIGVNAVHASERTLLGVQVSQLVSSTAGSTPNHIFSFAYDWSHSSSLFLNEHRKYWASTERSVKDFTLNRIQLGYSFHTLFGDHQFNFASGLEAGLGDPRTTYSKLALTSNVRFQLTNDWDAFFRVFGGSAQTSNNGLPKQTAFWLSGTSPLQAFEDLSTSSFGSGFRELIRNPVSSGPSVRGYYLLDRVGRVAVSSTVEISNNSLYPFGILKSIPYLGKLLSFTGLSLFADAGLVTDRFCTCRLKEDLTYDAGVGLRVLRFLHVQDVDLDRTELRLDFPFYLSHPTPGTPYLDFRMTAFFRQNF